MKFKKIISLSSLLTFLTLGLTGIVLYIVPAGRIAYWADWRMWGMTKETWGAIHINAGLLFLITGIFHVYYNWAPLMSYLKNKSRQLKILTPEFNVAALIMAVLVLCSIFRLPPFQWALDWSDAIKTAAIETYGEPPYGHAELSSLKGFAQRMNIDLMSAMEALKEANLKVASPQEPIKDIARNNHVSPQHLFMVMKSKSPVVDQKIKMPADPVSGLGKRTLAKECQTYEIPVAKALQTLAENHIIATADMKFKEVAQKHSMGPADVYQILYELKQAP